QRGLGALKESDPDREQDDRDAERDDKERQRSFVERHARTITVCLRLRWRGDTAAVHALDEAPIRRIAASLRARSATPTRPRARRRIVRRASGGRDTHEPSVPRPRRW